MLEDQGAIGDVAYLKRQAERCSRLAAMATDHRTSELLEVMAGEFERLAEYVTAWRREAPGKR